MRGNLSSQLSGKYHREESSTHTLICIGGLLHSLIHPACARLYCVRAQGIWLHTKD